MKQQRTNAARNTFGVYQQNLQPDCDWNFHAITPTGVVVQVFDANSNTPLTADGITLGKLAGVFINDVAVNVTSVAWTAPLLTLELGYEVPAASYLRVPPNWPSFRGLLGAYLTAKRLVLAPEPPPPEDPIPAWATWIGPYYEIQMVGAGWEMACKNTDACQEVTLGEFANKYEAINNGFRVWFPSGGAPAHQLTFVGGAGNWLNQTLGNMTGVTLFSA